MLPRDTPMLCTHLHKIAYIHVSHLIVHGSPVCDNFANKVFRNLFSKMANTFLSSQSR
uniref:Uncharacterized protein n=1 Tax=Anguilla anguilla TaxID=7936 RepID=A0A0E9VFG2_ANGAN